MWPRNGYVNRFKKDKGRPVGRPLKGDAAFRLQVALDRGVGSRGAGVGRRSRGGGVGLLGRLLAFDGGRGAGLHVVGLVGAACQLAVVTVGGDHLGDDGLVQRFGRQAVGLGLGVVLVGVALHDDARPAGLGLRLRRLLGLGDGRHGQAAGGVGARGGLDDGAVVGEAVQGSGSQGGEGEGGVQLLHSDSLAEEFGRNWPGHRDAPCVSNLLQQTWHICGVLCLLRCLYCVLSCNLCQQLFWFFEFVVNFCFPACLT